MVAAEVSDVSDVLSVRIDRTQPDAIEAPGTFTVSQNFTIEVANEGEPIHLHLSCDDDIAPAVELETGNHFVHRRGAYRIPVTVRADDRPVRGRVKLSVGYGAETAYVELRIVDPDPSEQVRVDESLSQPGGGVTEPTEPQTGVFDPITFATVGVAIAAAIGGIIIVGLLVDLLLGVVLAIVLLAVASGAFVFRDLS